MNLIEICECEICGVNFETKHTGAAYCPDCLEKVKLEKIDYDAMLAEKWPFSHGNR